jgi:DNA-binding CsgD family transcriptional regulator
MDKELYNSCLHLNNWAGFVQLMNHTFNNLISTLQTNYPDITHKEITWCCLFLLHVPTPEVLLLLDYKQDSLYKLKQRLVQKMNLKNTKELDNLLEDLVEGK